MALLDYTSYETIRATVGVSDTELPDDILARTMYETGVSERLKELNGTLPSVLATIRAIIPAQRTALQTRFINLIDVWAAYTVGKRLADGSLALFAPKTITDGKATQTRDDDPFDQLRKDLATTLLIWEGRLLSCLGLIDNTQTITTKIFPIFIGSVGLAVDPVSGAG